MILNPYYLGNLPLTFFNTINLIAYPFPNMVSTKIFIIKGSQGVQTFVMISTIIVPTNRFSIKNLVPYFQPPTLNPHYDSIILRVGYLSKTVVVLFMGV
jgi:hypothetical protein